MKNSGWYSVRCIFKKAKTSDQTNIYEERTTLWTATSADDAIRCAEDEAESYAKSAECEYTGFCNSYMLDNDPESGKEVFSICRESDLDAEEYLDSYYDTGSELTQIVDPESRLDNLRQYEEVLVDTLKQTRCKISTLESENAGPQRGKEVFSICRESDLDTEEYLDKYSDTGSELTQNGGPELRLDNLRQYEEVLIDALKQTRHKISKLEGTGQ